MPENVAHQDSVVDTVTETGGKPVGALVPESVPPIEYPNSDGKPIAESREELKTT